MTSLHRNTSHFLIGFSGKNMGGAYGGADFNPYDKSENEIQRFCQSYMTELSKYIGKHSESSDDISITHAHIYTLSTTHTLTYPLTWINRAWATRIYLSD